MIEDSQGQRSARGEQKLPTPRTAEMKSRNDTELSENRVIKLQPKTDLISILREEQTMSDNEKESFLDLMPLDEPSIVYKAKKTQSTGEKPHESSAYKTHSTNKFSQKQRS